MPRSSAFVAVQYSSVLGAIVVTVNGLTAAVLPILARRHQLPDWDEAGWLICAGILVVGLLSFVWLRLNAKYPMPPGFYRWSIPPMPVVSKVDLGVAWAVGTLASAIVLAVLIQLLKTLA